MLYEFAHFLQSHVKPVWSLAESANAALFRLRYGSLVKQLPAVISEYQGVKRVSQEDVANLASFFSNQPEWAFVHFQPHGFDAKSLAGLVNNPSMLMYIIEEDGALVGYFFLRCFFFGKSYLGKMVDAEWQGKGIGQKMCCCAMDMASSLKMRMFESISKENVASLQSTQKVLETKVIKELKNGSFYIEDVRKKPICG